LQQIEKIPNRATYLIHILISIAYYISISCIDRINKSKKAINIPHIPFKKNSNSMIFIDYQGIMLYTSLSTYRHPFFKDLQSSLSTSIKLDNCIKIYKKKNIMFLKTKNYGGIFINA
jgi:hypothetical protein